MADTKRETITYVTETKYDKESGLPIFLRVRVDDMLQAPPDGSPSEVIYDRQGREKYRRWHHMGKLHRSNGPASIDLSPDDGLVWVERFRIYGEKVGPNGGPHTIFYDPQSGDILEKSFSDDPIVRATTPKTTVEPKL